MTEERIGQALPTATGIGARLSGAPVSEQDFDSRQRRISAASETKCLEYTAEAMDDSAFGLHLAAEANLRDAGMLFYIASAANDVDEALELFVRYSRIVNEAMRIKLIPAPEALLPRSHSSTIPDTVRSRLPNLRLPSYLRGVREVVGRSIRPMLNPVRPIPTKADVSRCRVWRCYL